MKMIGQEKAYLRERMKVKPSVLLAVQLAGEVQFEGKPMEGAEEGNERILISIGNRRY